MVFQPAGCDRVLNSKKKVDKCGVCDGDNSSCRRFTGTFNKTRFGKVCALLSEDLALHYAFVTLCVAGLT